MQLLLSYIVQYSSSSTVQECSVSGSSTGFNFKLFSGRSNVFDLKAEIKKMMFDGDNMLPVSSDSGLFTIIMATFSQYEKIVCYLLDCL